MRGISLLFFFSSRRRHTRWNCDWSADVCSSDLELRRAERGAALGSPELAAEGIAMTRDFLSTLYGSVSKSAEAGRSLKQAFDAAREVMDPKFSSFAIYEHCLPFNVSRAYDEAKGIDVPVIWTAERDREMWA